MASARLIVYVEYKATFSANHARKKKQFERFRDLLRNHFPVGQGWRLVTAYGFGRWPRTEDGEKCLLPCKKCEKFTFLVDDKEGIGKFLEYLLALPPVNAGGPIQKEKDGQ